MFIPSYSQNCERIIPTKVCNYYKLSDQNVTTIHILVKCDDNIIRRYSTRAVLQKDGTWEIRQKAYLDE